MEGAMHQEGVREAERHTAIIGPLPRLQDKAVVRVLILQ
eukprot:CAMPEP_0171256252 /NCGR_PEP_ID=MMETSP0790-20130122/53202_1 /TAXON_ID=2925 /ORGANISM="Alexandrium catenella, Strain OF101" /LENGTH=38 /DNA_ID= /DNA_START= /DNA_END= /DNA_ORIENTATION=